MIYRDITVTVQGKTCRLDAPVYLYKGDGSVVFNITIQDLSYKFGRLLTTGNIVTDSIRYADISVLKPDGTTSFVIPHCQKKDNMIELVMRPQYMNDLNECGIYSFQIHLYDEQSRRITIPPFNFEVIDTIDVDNGEVEVAGVAMLDNTKKKKVTLRHFRNGEQINATKLNVLIDKITELEDKITDLQQELAQYKNDNRPIE